MGSLIQIRKPEGGNGSFAAKEAELFARLAELPSLLIAVSGGADSAYLAWAAKEELTVLRVLVMAKHLFELSPERGLAATPST